MKCPHCKTKITLIKSTWGDTYAVCNCGVKPYKEYKKFLKSANNPFARWEI